MRNFTGLFTLLLVLIIAGCSQTSQKTSIGPTGAAIKFETIEHDFGTIPYKGDGAFEFVFKSEGEEPLVLKNVRSSCGCTVPEWPKEPVMKGDKSKIRVVYNTRISGSFSKTISVFSNASEEPIILVIKGKVESEQPTMSDRPVLE